MEVMTVSAWAPWMFLLLIPVAGLVLIFSKWKSESGWKEIIIPLLLVGTFGFFVGGLTYNYNVTSTAALTSFEDTYSVRVEDDALGENALPLYSDQAKIVPLFVDNDVKMCAVSTTNGVYRVECDGEELKPRG